MTSIVLLDQTVSVSAQLDSNAIAQLTGLPSSPAARERVSLFGRSVTDIINISEQWIRATKRIRSAQLWHMLKFVSFASSWRHSTRWYLELQRRLGRNSPERRITIGTLDEKIDWRFTFTIRQ